MEQRILGRTGLEITPSASVPGRSAEIAMPSATGALLTTQESIAAIHAALDRGATWIDTAPGYGSGHSEEVVGRALKGLADRPLVFTKCGFVWNERFELTVDLSPGSIRAEAESSLRRLGSDAIDLYQIHWLEPENDPELEAAWQTLAELKAAGKVRHIGVSNLTVSQLERCEAIAPVETLQPPYSLLERDAESDLSVHGTRRHGSDRVLAHAVGPALRPHDARADRGPAGR